MNRLLQAFASGVVFVAAVSAHAKPPHHAPAYGDRDKHHYIYYPQKQFYFAPETQVWFWRDGGAWTMGASLPLAYQQYARGGYNVYLDSERPYEEHETVVSGYRHHRWTAYRYDDRNERGSPHPQHDSRN